jgi:hypothetical protein
MKMTTSTTETQETALATAASEKPEPLKKANTAPRKPHVAPAKGKVGKKATSSKQRAKAPKKAPKADGARQGSKTEKVLELLKRSGGANLKEIMRATDWQPHSVRGFISGTLGKKMGLKVESAKSEDGERVYSIAK